MLKKTKFKPGDFVIVNEIDRPDEKRIAMILPPDPYIPDEIRCGYIHEHLSNYETLPATDAVLVQDFGVEVCIDGDQYTTVQNGPMGMVAYQHGGRRDWQGGLTQTFKFKLNPATCDLLDKLEAANANA